jgi:tetratricopeptide (TPR) repeat protein
MASRTAENLVLAATVAGFLAAAALVALVAVVALSPPAAVASPVPPAGKSTVTVAPAAHALPKTGSGHRRSPSHPAAAAAPAGPEPWDEEPFTADPAAVARAAASFAGREGEPVVVLLSDQRYTLDAAGRETYTQRLVYRIVTAAADTSWSTVERSWSPWHQTRPEVRARVITPEGVAHLLDPAVLTESGEVQEDPDVFGDGRVLRGPLPATGPGVVVEQEVTVRDTAPFFDGGIVDLVDVTAAVSVLHARVVIEAPAAVPLRYTSHLLPAATPRDETLAALPPRRRLTFDYRDLPADEDAELALPPETPRSPYLAFSTGSSWADVARRYSVIVDAAIHASHTGDLAALVRAAAGPAPSQIETMSRVLQRLGDIRYTGVELGQGGILPRPPGETLRRKFGDCKDKAVLLVAALRLLDIPAYVALLSAGEDQQDIDSELPGFGGFNHAIVVVPGTPQLWIDPTDRFARPGELPPDDQGRLALIASPLTSGLTHTPEAEAGENRAIKTLDLVLSDQGAANAVESDDYWGVAERDLRAFYTTEDPDALREALSDYMRKTYLAKGLTSYDHANPLDLSRPFHLHLEARETKRAVSDETGATVAILAAPLLDQLPDEIIGKDRDKQPPPRLGPYYFSRPFSAEITYRIVPPPGFAPRPLPASRTRRLGTATLLETYSAGGGGVVTATLRLDSGKRRISTEEFERLRTAVRTLADAKPTLVQFEQVGESALAAGRVREAIEEFGREAAAAPKRALPHCRLARALLAGGLGEAARQEANRATRLEPRSALAERTLGWALEHDAVGRRFAPGFDRAGAIAAYRKAKSLDPDDETAHAELAIVLEHDAQGRRCGPGADLDAAIAEYQELHRVTKRSPLDDNLLAALLHAGRFADLRALAAELDDSPARDVLRLVAIAADDGAPAAVSDGERRLRDPAALVAALDGAAQELVMLRRYAEAAALLARAAQQSPNAAAFLARSDALRRAHRHEEAPAESPPSALPAGPAAAAREFLLAALADPPATERMLKMLSHGLDQILSPAARRQLVEAPGRGLRESPRSSELPVDVRLDLVLAAWHESLQGDDALGYRVEITSVVGETPGRTALFVVPENGAYRIAALGDVPATLGLEAQRRLAAHDLGGARQWLDWAREEERAALPALSAADGALPFNPLLALWDAPVAAADPRLPGPAGRSAAGEQPRLSPGTALISGSPGTPDSPESFPAACAAASLLVEGIGGPADLSRGWPARSSSPAAAAAGRSAGASTGGSFSAGLSDALLARLRTCGDRAGSEAQRWAVEIALAGAYGALGRHAEMLDAAGRLTAARPDSEIAFTLTAGALAGLARWADLDELARRRSQVHPDDPLARRAAARAALRRGDFAKAAAELRRLVDSGREEAGDLADLAWLALARGSPDDQAVEDAQRAAALSKYRDPAALQTLASLYAERGHPAEAYRIILQSIAARPFTGASAAAPDDADWYVFGHLAESYGLPLEARRLYARVRPGDPEELGQLFTFRLAQARLAALSAVSAGGAVSAVSAVSGARDLAAANHDVRR